MDEETTVGWVTIGEARTHWSDCPTNADTAGTVLAAAYEQCLAYAPAVEEVPERYALAQIMQARNLWTAFKAGRNDTIGPDGFAVTVFPMDWSVQNLLRPKRGIGLVG